MYKNFKKGISLVEVIIGSSIVLASLVGLVSAFHFYTQTATSNMSTIQATLLVEEGIEAVKYLRDLGWDSQIGTLAASTTYQLGWNGYHLVPTSTNTLISGGFERGFAVYDVYRDGNDDISGSGTLDSNTKKLTVNVSWSTKNGTTTRSITTYITNLWSD